MLAVIIQLIGYRKSTSVIPPPARCAQPIREFDEGSPLWMLVTVAESVSESQAAVLQRLNLNYLDSFS